jgi:hypothetical protein
MERRIKCPDCGQIFIVRNPKSPVRLPKHHPKDISKDMFPNWRELYCKGSGKLGIPEARWREIDEFEGGGE